LLDERDVIRHNHKRLAKLLLDKFCCPTCNP
jgi:transcription elongation factor Elf1